MNVALKSSVETGADRRAFGRRETHMSATVRLPNHTHLDCIVCDISEGGALLEFPSRTDIAGRLRLSFDGGNQDIICEVRHTRGNRVGVQFARNITLAARPIAAPVVSPSTLPAPRRTGIFSDNGRSNAASELVALRRKAAKRGAVTPEPITDAQSAPIVIEIPVIAEPTLPRDISGLLQSVAALAAERAVPRPLPARTYKTALVIEPIEIPEETVPRNMSSLLASVSALVAIGTVPRPLPARAFA